MSWCPKKCIQKAKKKKRQEAGRLIAHSHSGGAASRVAGLVEEPGNCTAETINRVNGDESGIEIID